MTLGARMLIGTILALLGVGGLLLQPEVAGVAICLLLVAAGVWLLYTGSRSRS